MIRDKCLSKAITLDLLDLLKISYFSLKGEIFYVNIHSGFNSLAAPPQIFIIPSGQQITFKNYSLSLAVEIPIISNRQKLRNHSGVL